MEFTRETIAQLQTSYSVDVKMHLASNECLETVLSVPVRKGFTFNDLLSQFENLTNSSEMKLFVNGQAVNRNTKVHKVLKLGQKLLIWAV